MLKSLLLSSVRPFYDAEKEQGVEKTAKEKERESIEISDTTTGDKKEGEDDTEKDDKDTVGEGDEGNDDTEKEDEDGEKEVDEEKEKVELTAEQKSIAKLEKTIERLQKRVGRTTGERDTIRRELADAKAALEAKAPEDGKGLSEEEVERRANEKAKQIVADTEFNKAQQKLIKDATKLDKDFMKKIKEVAEDVAPMPDYMIGMLEDLDNGGAVLSYLANNPDEYEEVLSAGNAIKMTRRLDKISQQVAEAAKPAKKEISKVPAPNEPIKGNERSPMNLTGKESMDDFARIRAQQVEERRKLKMGM